MEDKLLLYGSARGARSPELDEAIDTLSKSTFGVTLEETVFRFPQGYDDLPDHSPKRWRIDDMFDEFENQFETSEATDDEAVEALLRHGLDFRDARGFPMLCTMRFCRQAEAAAKGIMGKIPDRTAADVESWAKQMELAAKMHLDKKRGG
jgi:hypothetical protein